MLKESPTFTHLFVKFTIRAVFNLLQGQWSRPLQDPFELRAPCIIMHFSCSLILVPRSQQSAAVHQVTPSPLNATHSHKNYVFFFQLCFQMLYSISQMYTVQYWRIEVHIQVHSVVWLPFDKTKITQTLQIGIELFQNCKEVNSNFSF